MTQYIVQTPPTSICGGFKGLIYSMLHCVLYKETQTPLASICRIFAVQQAPWQIHNKTKSTANPQHPDTLKYLVQFVVYAMSSSKSARNQSSEVWAFEVRNKQQANCSTSGESYTATCTTFCTTSLRLDGNGPNGFLAGTHWSPRKPTGLSLSIQRYDLCASDVTA